MEDVSEILIIGDLLTELFTFTNDLVTSYDSRRPICRWILSFIFVVGSLTKDLEDSFPSKQLSSILSSLGVIGFKFLFLGVSLPNALLGLGDYF